MMRENFKMAKKRFYGVAGINGYGVYNNYEKVLEARPYIRGFMVKGFPYFREAKTYAVDTYKQSVYGTTDIDGTYEIKRINRFYRKNPAKEQKSQCTPHKTNYTDNSTKIHIIPFTIDIKDRSLQDITHLE